MKTTILTDRIIIDDVPHYFVAHRWDGGGKLWVTILTWLNDDDEYVEHDIPQYELHRAVGTAYAELDAWRIRMALKSLESDVANNVPGAALQLAAFKEQHGSR